MVDLMAHEFFAGEEHVPFCDVVIVNFDAGPHLREAISTALASPCVVKMFLVDNASTDGSIDGLDFAQEERLVLIRNRKNFGFARAANLGLEQSSAEYVLSLNPDCRVVPGAIEQLMDVLQDRSDAGMAGPLLLNADGSEQAGGRRKIPTPRLAIVRALGLGRLGRLFPSALGDFLLHQQPLPRDAVEVEAISGACMMVRRAALADVGPLDEQYFLHCEDLDWCVRFNHRGWKILFVPTASVVHEKGVSSKDRPLAVEWHKHVGMVRFYHKFFRDKQSAWLTPLVVMGVWLRFAAISSYLLVTRKKLR